MGSGFHGTFFEVFEGASLFLFAFFLFQDLVALVTLRGAEFDSAGDAGGGVAREATWFRGKAARSACHKNATRAKPTFKPFCR